MSFEIPGLEISLLSSGDMSSNQYKAVSASTTNSIDGAIVVATRGGRPNGVWQHNSTTAEAGGLLITGVTKMVAGDSSAMENAIAAGDPVVASSNGHAVPSTGAGQPLLGLALEALSTGSTGIISVQLAIGAIST